MRMRFSLEIKIFSFCENYSTDAVSGARHAFAVKLAYVLVSVRAHDTATVAMESQIEGRSVLIDRKVERR